MQHILYLVPTRLGDTLMLTPALALLKQLKSPCEIDILAFGALGSEVYKNNPHVNTTHLWSDISKNMDSFLQPYDVVVAAHRHPKTYEALLTLKKPIIWIEPADQGQAQAQQVLNFIRRVFKGDGAPQPAMGYELYPSAEDFEQARIMLPSDQQYIGLHLGCHGLAKPSIFPWRTRLQHKKVWPIANFLKLARHLQSSHPSYRIVLTGSQYEQQLARAFTKDFPQAIDLVGKTDVLLLAAIMRIFKAYICSDTGPMHIACSMNTPLLALFGPTNAVRTGPYPVNRLRKEIITNNLFLLESEVVMSALDDLLSNIDE